ncbi:MAG TPA: tetratricopeptide repeat protein [Chthoniobacterales bacterium]|jgi:TolB-like protein/class 3 adenylate cyclase|nr:tetratricopeptide repeat protein [Chthoniobacterales bacterium]
MADESKTKQRLEIAHVLFMDIVGYSKLLTDEQSEALQELNQIVHNTEAAREAEAAGQLTILPTGDGMALVFTGSVEEPVECALEISHALRAQPSLPVRMGIHSGPVHHVKDANERENIAGVGINIAQRVMDCGDAGHILVSKRVADDLAQQRRWQPYLHELGDVEVKHGVVVSLVNLYAETIGNPTPPTRIGKVRGSIPRSRVGTRKALSPLVRTIFAVVVLLIALAIVSVIFAPAIMRSLGKGQVTSPQVPAIPSPPSIADTIKSDVAKKVKDALQDALSTEKKAAVESPPSGSVVPEKSIAVLPFENLSSDKENAYFAEGIQDEILTRLSKIAALKVISRTSTQKYKTAPDNLREVGQQLGVANVLEGSVQKAGNAVHINVQLIKAATDAHLWAESYDRELQNIFGVEGEVAGKIAGALDAKLSGAEKQILAQKPTDNPAAYEAYLRGKALMQEGNEAAAGAAIKSYEEAVRLDPQFALAWAGLSSARSVGFYYMDSRPAARAGAEQSLAKAEALQPDLPEVQLARASFDYFVVGDNKRVRDVLQQLHLIWPNNDEVINLLGATYQRLGEWQKAIDAFDQVIVLNPRYLLVRKFAAYNRNDVRDWPGAQRIVDEALQIWPGDVNLLAIKAQIFQANGQLDEAQLIVDKLKPDRLDYDAVGAVWYQAKLRRKPATALKLIEPLARRTDSLKEWVRDAQVLGDLQQLSGDTVAARATFSSVRDTAEAGLREQPDNVRFLGLLSLASAVLGERDKALQAIDKKISLQNNDARVQPSSQETKARILAHFGDKDGALAILSRLLEVSYEGGLFGPPLTPALLRLDPDWDNLRGDPRFQKLAEDKSK